jgi:hypothetical protein
MSALAKMMTDMLLKELSPEIREQLTPENISRLGASVGAFFREQKTQGELMRKIADKLGIEHDDGISSSGTGDASGADTVKRIGAG